MAREAIATAEIVNSACDTLFAEHGREPTVAEIIKSIGGGSATTVSKLRQEWLKQHRDAKAAQPEPPKAEVRKDDQEVAVPARVEDMSDVAEGLERFHSALGDLVLRAVSTRVQAALDKGQVVQQSLIDGYERKLRDKDGSHRETVESLEGRIATLEGEKEALDQQWAGQYDEAVGGKDIEIDGHLATIAERDQAIQQHLAIIEQRDATIARHGAIDAARQSGRDAAAEQRPDTDNPHTDDQDLHAAWSEGWTIVTLRARAAALETDLAQLAEEVATLEDQRAAAVRLQGEAAGKQAAAEAEAERLRAAVEAMRPKAEAANRIPDLEAAIARADALAQDRAEEINRLLKALDVANADLARVRAQRDQAIKGQDTTATPAPVPAPAQEAPAKGHRAKKDAIVAPVVDEQPEAQP